jgi:hypothetical protein
MSDTTNVVSGTGAIDAANMGEGNILKGIEGAGVLDTDLIKGLSSIFVKLNFISNGNDDGIQNQFSGASFKAQVTKNGILGSGNFTDLNKAGRQAVFKVNGR